MILCLKTDFGSSSEKGNGMMLDQATLIFRIFNAEPRCDMATFLTCIDIAGTTKKELKLSLFLDACSQGQVGVIERLDVDPLDVRDGLKKAIENGHLNVVQYLVKQTMPSGEYLKVAVQLNEPNMEIIKCLVEVLGENVVLLEDLERLPYLDIPIPIIKYLVARGLSRYAFRGVRTMHNGYLR